MEYCCHFWVGATSYYLELQDKLYTNNHRDSLSSADVKNALDNIHKDFVVDLVDTAIRISLLFVKGFMTLLSLENWHGIIQTKMVVGIQFWAPNFGLGPKYDKVTF